MIRVTPVRVKIDVSVATSSGSPRWARPPLPEYSPSLFSRTMTQSISWAGIAQRAAHARQDAHRADIGVLVEALADGRRSPQRVTSSGRSGCRRHRRRWRRRRARRWFCPGTLVQIRIARVSTFDACGEGRYGLPAAGGKVRYDTGLVPTTNPKCSRITAADPKPASAPVREARRRIAELALTTWWRH